MAEPTARWGLVGPGQIAAVFAESLRETGVGELVAVAGRSPLRTADFCEKHGGRAATLEALLSDPEVEAVYVATPHARHPEAVRAALDAGKAVLCEKPLATTAAVTRELHDTARRLGLPLVEGWMYRHHPQLTRALEILRQGSLGRPQKLVSGFGFHEPFVLEHRLFDPELGGGAILDVGGYPVSLAMLLAGLADKGRRVEDMHDDPTRIEPRRRERLPFLQPYSMDATARLSDERVDLHAEARLLFPGGFEAEVHASLEEDTGCTAVVECNLGELSFENPFLPEGLRRGRVGRLTVKPVGDPAYTIEVEAPLDCFALEARMMAQLLESGETQPPPPLVDAEESISIARTLQAWREAVNAC